MGLWAQPPSPLPIAGKIYPSCVPAPLAFPPTTQSDPCPMTGWAWDLPTGEGEAGLADLMGPVGLTRR